MKNEMELKDFVYDGQYLSDYGFFVGKIGSGDNFIIEKGAKLVFDKIPKNYGRRHLLASASYDGAYSAQFDIFKNPEINNDLFLTDDEFRDLMRWLNRREYLQFCFIPDNGEETEKYYDASFNVDKILVDGRCLGLHLTMETNSAKGYGQELVSRYNISDTNIIFTLADMSDEVGYTYPDVVIEIMRDGDLRICNQTLQHTTEIKNCVVGEKITMQGALGIIQTDNEDHKLADDFNFNFLKIGNTINNRQNKLSFSLPCKITIKYRPNIM